MKIAHSGLVWAVALAMVVSTASYANTLEYGEADAEEIQTEDNVLEPGEIEADTPEDGEGSDPEGPAVGIEPDVESLEVVKLPKGTYSIMPASDTTLSIGIKGASVMSGVAVRLEDDDKLGSQRWVLKPASGKRCYILNAKSGKALTVTNPKNPEGSGVCQKTLSETSAQTWQLRKSGKAYVISSVLKGSYCLSAGSSASSSLRLRSYSESKRLLFAFKNSSYSLGKSALIESVNYAKSSSGISAFGGARFDKDSAAGKRLQEALSSLRRSCGTCAFLMMDLETGAGVCSNANQVVYGASTIKGPYIAAICKYAPSRIDSSAKSHIAPVASWSSNDDYKSLRSRFGASPMASFMKYCGVTEISSSSTWVSYSPKTLGKFWVGTYWYLFKDQNKHSGYLKGQFKKGASSFIKSALSSKRATYTKAGWGPFPESGNIYNDAGIVTKDGHPYLVVVLSKAYYSKGKLETLVNAIDDYYGYMRR